MSDVHRRTFLTTLSGAVMTISGCQRFQSPSAGSLIVENHHDLPHVLTVKVVTYSPDGETELGRETGRVALEPDETKRYTDYFDTSLSYEVIATMLDADRVRVPYGREGIATTENLVFFEVTDGGTLNGGLRSV